MEDVLYIPGSSPRAHKLTGGALRPTGKLIEGTGAHRGPTEDVYTEPSISGIDAANVEKIASPIALCGWNLRHFGHFITETAGACWYSSYLQDDIKRCFFDPFERIDSNPFRKMFGDNETQFLSAVNIHAKN